MVDDVINASNAVDRFYKVQDRSGAEVVSDMESHISDFIAVALGGEPDPEILYESIDAMRGQDAYDSIVILLAKVASGRAGMYEARELLNHMARAYAWVKTVDADDADRVSEYYAGFAAKSKPTLATTADNP
jgi:hypothetical protein